MSALYQQIILEHARAPRHAGQLAAPEHTLHGLNPLCGDEIWIYLRGLAAPALTASFESSGCSLCRASGSVLLELANGHSAAALAPLVAAFRGRFAAGAEPWDQAPPGVAALFDIRAYPARSRCVLLAWETLAEVLDGPGVSSQNAPAGDIP
jgi:nitrogen fixation NifU-like protein